MSAPQASSNFVVRLLFVERDGRRGQRHQRRRAAGNQTEHQVVRAGLLRQFRRCGERPSTPCSSGTGWPHSFSSMRRSLAVWPYFTLSRPPVIRRPRTRSARGHGGAGLARADHVDIAIAFSTSRLQVPDHRVDRIGCLERGAEDGERLLAKSGFQLHMCNHGRVRMLLRPQPPHWIVARDPNRDSRPGRSLACALS